jgi:hypothetical protein
MPMGHKKRTDRNQAEIVKALRQVGASVGHTHEVGKGFPDIVFLLRESDNYYTRFTDSK